MPSFDVVSEVDWHEVSNAVDQANREVSNRFDFKGSDAKLVLADKIVSLDAESDFQLDQILDILRVKLTKRQVDLGFLQIDDPAVLHQRATQTVRFQDGLDTDLAKKIVKQVKAEKFKVQCQIQGDKLRVTGKKRDDLQSVITYMKGKQEDWAPLNFNNFRD